MGKIKFQQTESQGFFIVVLVQRIENVIFVPYEGSSVIPYSTPGSEQDQLQRKSNYKKLKVLLKKMLLCINK
jgi:hypothetical protein